MTKARTHVWREPVDAQHVAAIGFVEFVYRGDYHAASAFVIIPKTDYSWRTQAEHRLREHIIKDHNGYVPYIRRARDEAARAD